MGELSFLLLMGDLCVFTNLINWWTTSWPMLSCLFSHLGNNPEMKSVAYAPSKEEGPVGAGSVGDSRPAPLSSFSPASTVLRRDRPPRAPTLSCLGEPDFFPPKTNSNTSLSFIDMFLVDISCVYQGCIYLIRKQNCNVVKYYWKKKFKNYFPFYIIFCNLGYGHINLYKCIIYIFALYLL